jgi:hypothetical protein
MSDFKSTVEKCCEVLKNFVDDEVEPVFLDLQEESLAPSEEGGPLYCEKTIRRIFFELKKAQKAIFELETAIYNLKTGAKNECNFNYSNEL